MKVRMTLEVSDTARRFISRELHPTRKSRMASRKEVVARFERVLAALEAAADESENGVGETVSAADAMQRAVDNRSSYQRGSDQVRDRIGKPRIDHGDYSAKPTREPIARRDIDSQRLHWFSDDE